MAGQYHRLCSESSQGHCLGLEAQQLESAADLLSAQAGLKDGLQRYPGSLARFSDQAELETIFHI